MNKHHRGYFKSGSSMLGVGGRGKGGLTQTIKTTWGARVRHKEIVQMNL